MKQIIFFPLLVNIENNKIIGAESTLDEVKTYFKVFKPTAYASLQDAILKGIK